jgi:hypothetical protein
MNTTGFTYSINAPVTGPIIRLGATSNGGSEYSIQLSGQYYAAQRLFYRTRNGDNGTFGSWLEFWHTGNFDPSTYDNGLFVKKSGDTMTGTLNGTTANFSGNVTAAFFDGSLINRGNYANSTPGTTTGPYGLSLWKVYNNGYPTTYGNLIHVSGDGGGQLLVGWSGVDGADAGVYVRSKRDNSTGAWSAWREFWTTANFNPATYDSGLFVKKSGDTMTGELTIASPIGGTSLRITQDGTNYISFYGNEIRSNTSGNLHINYADVNGSQANRMHTFIYDGSGSAGIIATFNGSNKSSTFSGAVNVEGVLNGTSASLSQGLSAGGHISSSTTSSNVSIDIGGDLNSITNNASYRSSSAANLPSAGNWYYVNTYNHNGNWRLQVAHGYGAGVFPRGIWYRNGGDVPDGTNGWDNWTKVIDSRNLPTSLSDYYGLSAVKYNNETYIYTPTASPSVTIGVAPVSSGAGTQSAIKNIYTIDAAISGTLSSANINISNGVSGASGSLAQALGMLNGVSIGRSFGSGVVSNSGSGDVEKIGTKFVSINLSMTLVSNGAGGAFKSWTVCTFSLPSQLSVQTQALSVHTGSATNIFTAYVSSVANGTCTVYVSGFVSSGNIGETMAYISGLILI